MSFRRTTGLPFMTMEHPDLTPAGGLDLPAEVAGRVAADEIVVHG